MARSKVKHARREKRALALPSFLPGMRGSAMWHARSAERGETPHTVNKLGAHGEFVIPMSGSDEDEFVKIHELLHAAHSPVEPPRDIVLDDGTIVHARYLLMAEELRINLTARVLVGNEAMPDFTKRDKEVSEHMMKTALESGTTSAIEDFLEWTVISWPLNKFHEFNSYPPAITNFAGGSAGHITDAVSRITHAVYMEIRDNGLEELINTGKPYGWDVVIRTAHKLENFVRAMTEPEEESEFDGSPDLGSIEAALNAEMSTYEPPDLPEHVRAARKAAMKQLKEQRDKEMAEYAERYGEDYGTPKWGEMEIRDLKKTLSLPKAKIARSKWSAHEEGTIPRYVHRLTIDGKIFGRKKRVNGGSVLIDDSGSMSFTNQQIKDIIEAAPAVNIAAYSGSGGRGELVIIAKDGKYADMDKRMNRPFGGDNLVDLPALEWLAEMPKPRIWVSDTMITLVSGDTRLGLRQVYEHILKHDINVVDDATAAHEVFTGKRFIYR